MTTERVTSPIVHQLTAVIGVNVKNKHDVPENNHVVDTAERSQHRDPRLLPDGCLFDFRAISGISIRGSSWRFWEDICHIVTNVAVFLFRTQGSNLRISKVSGRGLLWTASATCQASGGSQHGSIDESDHEQTIRKVRKWEQEEPGCQRGDYGAYLP